jgi:hypothetical protein
VSTEHVTWRSPPRSSLQYPAALALLFEGAMMISAAELLQEDIGTTEA